MAAVASPSRPEKQAVPAQVSTHWPTRATSCLPRSLSPIANSRTAIPGRPSGVSSAANSRSMPASQPQAITEVAKPVMASAAVRAQRGSSAVISSRVARIGNASAKVSSIVTPLRCTGSNASLISRRL